MSEQSEIRYDSKYNFFELDDGLRIPGVGILHSYQELYPDFIDIFLLYSLKSGDFVRGIVRDVDEDDDDDEYRPNKKVTYRIPIGQYVNFEIRVVPNIFTKIFANLVEVYTENPKNLLEDEESLSVKTLDKVSSVIYFQQMNNLKNTTVLTARLIELATDLTKRINENNDYSIEIPHLYPAVVYDWKEIKQMILNLRQPLDPNV